MSYEGNGTGGGAPWFRERRHRSAPPNEHQQWTADKLLAYITKRRHELHEPDAWVHAETRHMVYVATPGYTPLRPGDTVHYSNIMNIRFLTHDMVYVGCGYIVGLLKTSHIYKHDRGAIQVESLDVAFTRGKRLLFNLTRSSLPRYDICVRALQSLGCYDYHPILFNCQHAVDRIVGNSWYSVGVIRMMALCIGVLLVLMAACGLCIAGIVRVVKK